MEHETESPRKEGLCNDDGNVYPILFSRNFGCIFRKTSPEVKTGKLGYVCQGFRALFVAAIAIYLVDGINVALTSAFLRSRLK